MKKIVVKGKEGAFIHIAVKQLLSFDRIGLSVGKEYGKYGKITGC